MLTSTEPCDEFRPMVTERFFIRYSNSRPSSRATTDPDIPLTAIFISLKFPSREISKWSSRRLMLGREACLQNLVGGSNQRMRNKYEGTCQPGDSGSNPQPRQRERENDKLYQTNPGGGAGLIDIGSDQWLCGPGGEKWNPPIRSETNKKVSLRVGCAVCWLTRM